MNNIDKLKEQLKRANKETESLLTKDDDMIIQVGMSDCENLACFFRHFTVSSLKKPLIINPNTVEEKITYLSENLKLIELDKDRTILRSYPPLEDEKKIIYFEMKIKPLSMIFSRYAYTKKLGWRTDIFTILTKENLNRLIEDFVSIVQTE